MSESGRGGIESSHEIWDVIDQVCDRFEAAWKSDQAPAIQESLEVQLPDGAGSEARRALLVELVKLDIRYRWQHASDGFLAHIR